MINCFNVLKELDFEHIAGSKEEEKARNIIIKYLEESNIKYDIESFDLHSFDAGKGEIRVNDISLNLLPYGLVESQEITGELVIIDNINIISANKGAFKDKIIMCKGASRDLFDELNKTGAKCFLNISAAHKEAMNLSHRQKCVENGIFPAATIKYDDAVKLIPYNGQEVKVIIEQVRESRKACNIVCTLGNANIDNNITYLTAHYDTVAKSHGSSDNGAGSVAILKVAQYFAEHVPNRLLKVIFCSGEEMGLLGSSAFVEQHLAEIKENGSFVVNVDVAGDYFGNDVMAVLGTKELSGYCAGIAREAGYFFKNYLDIYSSDCMPFSVYEIPSINLARFGGNASNIIHTIDDQIDQIYGDNLEFYYEATKTILERTLNAQYWPIPKGIDSSLRSKVEKYMWGSRREEPKLQWTPSYKR